ncbi:microtubule-binding protein TANGLED [Coffea arabica]|uniref:Microtubule-binding protein TANGLED n=1 Tax=Coffea arabica TaxID=13443 RepID=A0A6P6WGJ2_COFAR
MVARTPPNHQQKKMVAPPPPPPPLLDPTLIRETVNKVDKSIARLQELQFTVTGGTKVISGVTLSPRSTRSYLRTSLRCKQESLRIKNVTARRSPPGKLPTNTGDWKRMSLPAMLLGETVGEILQASQFARRIVETVASNKPNRPADDPKTPLTHRRRNQMTPNPENSELRIRRKREKQVALQSIRSESDAPSLQRAKSRINFKVSPLHKNNCDKENCRFIANRVSPRNRPWARKTVLFPNPLFHSSSPTSQHQRLCKTKSPVIARNRQVLENKFLIKFLIKSPPSASKFHVKIRSPPLSISPTRSISLIKRSPKVSTTAKLRRSFSPSRLASKIVSPLKSRKSVQNKTDGMKMMMSGLKQRPTTATPMQFAAPRI